MTLLLSVFAAVIVTILWYTNQNARELKVGLLCYMFWGASLMWMVDAIAEYVELKAAYFTPTLEDMINDTFLGLSVVAFALVIWVAYVLMKDPKNVVRASKSNR